MDSWIFEHRAAIDFAARAFMFFAGWYAGRTILRDVRAAWPRIVALFKERNGE
jgi:hydrogenase maturation factor HypE